MAVGAASAAEVTLRLGGPWTTGSNLHKGMEAFAQTLAAESKGHFEVKVFPDSQLGDIQQLLTGVQLGTIDLAYLAIGNAGQFEGRRAASTWPTYPICSRARPRRQRR